MTYGQKRFFDYIMKRALEQKEKDLEALLKEGFSKQAKGVFTAEYREEYASRMLALLKPEHMEEVKAIMDQYGPEDTNS